jgi:hypothetical protein
MSIGTGAGLMAYSASWVVIGVSLARGVRQVQATSG